MRRVARLLLALAVMLVAVVVAASPAAATTLIDETFTHGTVSNPNFLVGGTVETDSVSPCLTAGTNLSQTPIPGCPAGEPSIPAGGDPDGQGALRLTSNTNDSTGFILYTSALPFTAGLDVTFSFFNYNSIPTDTGIGADGTTFFLSDGSQPLHTPGAWGGSLGYAQRDTPFVQDGLLGAYLGVGFDEWGNFANNEEGRGQGCDQPVYGLYPSYVTLRGPGNGQTGYCIRDSVDVSSRGTIDAPFATSRTDPDVKRTVHIVVDPLAQPGAHILVQLAYGNGPMETVLDQPQPPNPPATFKFGFAAGTGGANNIHEIQLVKINSILPLPRLALTKSNSGPFVVGGAGSFTLTASTQSAADVGPESQPVTVSDDLPAGTLSGAPSGSGWDCAASAGIHVRCTYPASDASPIAPGTQLPPIQVPVRFGPDESGIFVNTAQASSQDNANTPQQSSASSTFRVLPVGQDDFATTTVGVPVSVPILANDHGSLQPDSVIITRQPANGTAAWHAATEEAVYTPDPGFSGIDTFTYTVFDQDGQPVNQTVTITVTPRANDDSATTPVNTPVTIDVLANDLGNLNPGTVQVTTPPGHGSVRIDPATGRATYTPAPGFTGTDTFVYTVRDHAGQATSATVTIIVYAPPSPPPPPPPVPHDVGRIDLVVTKLVSPSVAAVGDVLTYTVTVTNRGPDVAHQVVGTDASRGHYRVVSLTTTQGTCRALPFPQCSFGDVAVGQRVTIVGRVVALSPGVVSDVAAVTSSDDDPNPAGLHARAVVRVLAAPLSITKRASARRVLTGGQVSFFIQVTNHSTRTIRHISVCDRLPSGLAHVSGGTQRGGQVCWTLAALTAGHRRSFAVLARAMATRSRVVTNVATVAAPGTPTRRAAAVVVIVGPPRFTG